MGNLTSYKTCKIQPGIGTQVCQNPKQQSLYEVAAFTESIFKILITVYSPKFLILEARKEGRRKEKFISLTFTQGEVFFFFPPQEIIEWVILGFESFYPPYFSLSLLSVSFWAFGGLVLPKASSLHISSESTQPPTCSSHDPHFSKSGRF